MANSTTRFSQLMGAPCTRQSVIQSLQSDPATYQLYQQMIPVYQEKILNFLTGQRGLEILYDGIFQQILNPNLYPERLEDFLSQLIRQPVKIKELLPREGNRISDHSSFVIMDILVLLQDKSLVNIEVQKIGYYFPAERSNCYISDLIMRQYNQVKAKRGKKFSYKDLTPVYVIILMEESPSEFRQAAPHYIHERQISYSSGVQLKDLENVYFITLDIFRSVVQNITNKLDAWLTFFSCEESERILELVDTYPEFVQYYEDIAKFRNNPKELIHMYSEALYLLDRNTEKYMVEEMKADLQKKDATINTLTFTNQEQASTINQQSNLIEELQKQIALLKAEKTTNI